MDFGLYHKVLVLPGCLCQLAETCSSFADSVVDISLSRETVEVMVDPK